MLWSYFLRYDMHSPAYYDGWKKIQHAWSVHNVLDTLSTLLDYSGRSRQLFLAFNDARLTPLIMPVNRFASILRKSIVNLKKVLRSWCFPVISGVKYHRLLLNISYKPFSKNSLFKKILDKTKKSSIIIFLCRGFRQN